MRATTVIAIGILAIILIASGMQISKLKSPTGQSVLTTVEITGATTEAVCTIKIREGLNLISNACDIANSTPVKVFATLNGSYQGVFTYDSTDSDKWKAYNPNLPGWVVNDLTNITTEKGYYVLANSTATLVVNGSVNSINIFAVRKGLNLIGYPILSSKTVANAFSTLSAGQLVTIYAYNSTTGRYEFFDMRNSTGNLTLITTGRGYFINITSDANWGVIDG